MFVPFCPVRNCKIVDVGGVWVDAVAGGVLGVRALYDPEVVIIGGGAAGAGDAPLVPLRKGLVPADAPEESG